MERRDHSVDEEREEEVRAAAMKAAAAARERQGVAGVCYTGVM